MMEKNRRTAGFPGGASGNGTGGTGRAGPVRSARNGPIGTASCHGPSTDERTHCRTARSGQQKQTFSRRDSCAPRQRADTTPPPAGVGLEYSRNRASRTI